MIKYILADILQYILNDYLDHGEIEKYNNCFNFKFNIEKYMIIIKTSRAGGYLYTHHTYLDDELIKQEVFSNKENKYSEENYKNGKLNGKQIRYDSEGKITSETVFINNKPINYDSEVDSLIYDKKRCCIIS
jgi:antitoxin component YwqK of YwqJK toxin-antitoxin module